MSPTEQSRNQEKIITWKMIVFTYTKILVYHQEEADEMFRFRSDKHSNAVLACNTQNEQNKTGASEAA